MDQLRAHGVVPPRGELPADLSIGQRVEVPLDQLDLVRTALHDAGKLLGFNIDRENGQAWVVVEDDDLEALERIATTLRGSA